MWQKMAKGFVYIEAHTYLSVKLTFDLRLELIGSFAVNIQGGGKSRYKNFNRGNKLSTFKE